MRPFGQTSGTLCGGSLPSAPILLLPAIRDKSK
jgi:hypothetical protein